MVTFFKTCAIGRVFYKNEKKVFLHSINIFSSEVEVDWDELILTTSSENVHSYLLEFVAFVNKEMVYHLPDLCGSLIQSNRKRFVLV